MSKQRKFISNLTTSAIQDLFNRCYSLPDEIVDGNNKFMSISLSKDVVLNIKTWSDLATRSDYTPPCPKPSKIPKRPPPKEQPRCLNSMKRERMFKQR
jgi:hypothetical protein